MVFTIGDFELLRLLRWCQYSLPADLISIATEAQLLNLVGTGLARQSKENGALTLSAKGNTLLERTHPHHIPKATQSYHSEAITRRLRLAHLAITAYRGGVHIFTTDIEELRKAPSLFLPSISRGRGSNPWSNTRIAAACHLGGTAYALHYVCANIGKLILADELAAFSRNTSALQPHGQALMFAGESYHAVWEALTQHEPPSQGRLITYGEAYHRCPLPVHLLSCDATGAKQLAIMTVEGYREKLTHAALKGQYQPPAPGLDCDAMYDGHPFVMAADMDLRRIDTLCQAAADGQCKPPVLAALEEQATAILHSRYRDSGKARVFALTDGALTEALGFIPTPHEPPRAPFLTEKGEMLDAPHIRAPQSFFPAGGKRRRQG